MMQILNLTQHNATPSQVKAGVVEPVFKDCIKSLITFEDIPTKAGMESRASKLAHYAKEDGFDYVLLGGASFFMPILEKTCKEAGLHCLYAFSDRVVKEIVFPDGRILKEAEFQHKGFYEA